MANQQPWEPDPLTAKLAEIDTLCERVKMLEKIVYGLVTLILVAVVGGMLKLVLTQGGNEKISNGNPTSIISK
jgi:uncharacterized membrane-anchored protein